MINIASSQPVHWPVSPPAVAVAPVSAVTPVKPAQQSPREGQSGLGSDRQAQAHASPGLNPKKTPDQGSVTQSFEAAPILPRDKPKDGQSPGATPSQEDAKQQGQDELAAQDESSAQKQSLLDVLSSVWKASAAVVENVLGRGEDAANGAGVANQLDVSATSAPKGMGDSAHERRANLAVVRDDGRVPAGSEPPTVYTEQGASEWSALEMGRLVSKKA